MLDKLKSVLRDPPPAMAFEISEAGISAARIGTRAELDFAPLPAGALAVSPLRENVIDEDAFSQTVRSLISSQKRKEVALILPDFCTRIAVLDFDSFPSEPKEQASLIRFRLKRSLPFDAESAVLSYFAQPVLRKHIDVVAVMSPQEIVARYEAPFRAAGLNPGVVTTSSMAALELASESGLSVIAKITGRVITVLAREKSTLKLVRCLEIPSSHLDDVSAVLAPTLVYVEDNLGGRAERLILCGFGPQSEEAQRRFEPEFGIAVEIMRSPLGVPGENNAGLLGYLRSIARNN
jgi:type IV pilus assembly protein PilM